MVGHTAPILKADRDRFDDMQQACIPCMLYGWPSIPGEAQHVTEAGRRIGHQYTYRSCAYHHRGELGHFATSYDARQARGPSFALSKQDFARTFGSERELVQIQDGLIAAIRAARKAGQYLPRMELMELTSRLHREIVLRLPDGNEAWRRTSTNSWDRQT